MEVKVWNKKDKFKYKRLEEFNKLMNSIIAELEEDEVLNDNYFDKEEIKITEEELELLNEFEEENWDEK